ncbi:hypothetical protein ACLB2K_036115 [Fragaria x ananassa]
MLSLFLSKTFIHPHRHYSPFVDLVLLKSKMADSAKSLKEYLKRYESSNNADETKKKRKKKQKSKTEAMGVKVVDEDPVWQKPVKLKGEEDDKDSGGDEEEEKPLVDEDIEVKRMRRLELLRARRPYDAISEDGSGWVKVPLKREGSEEADLSPPRKRFCSPSPEHGMDSRGSDLLPPRKSRRGGDEDLSPPRKSRNNVDDLSPPRNSRNSVADLSPLRKSRNNVEDLSPPRKSRNNVEDLSPPRKSRNNVEDFSPPRKRRNNVEDLSPPRKRRNNVADLSPPRKSRNNGEDLSPPRKRQNNVADLSPPRKSRINGDADLSPPRKKKQLSPGPVKEKPKSGLISGRDISEEISKTKRAEQLRFQQMDPSETGENAANVFRNKKTGERMSEEEKLKSEKKRDEKPKEIKVEWGKGLAQKREAEAKLEALEREKEKPFARTRDDPELDKMMKEKVRWGDPMAHLVKKRFPEAVLPNLGDSDKMKESGFIIPQDIPNHSWLKRGLSAASNRYGIKPGRHWDGVDRSNGFEKKLVEQINEKQATEAEAYLWWFHSLFLYQGLLTRRPKQRCRPTATGVKAQPNGLKEYPKSPGSDGGSTAAIESVVSSGGCSRGSIRPLYNSSVAVASDILGFRR